MRIIVYGRPNCVGCKYSLQELDKLGLRYDYIDVTLDRDAAKDVEKMGYLTLPVVVVSNSKRTETWGGFRLEKLRGLRPTGDY